MGKAMSTSARDENNGVLWYLQHSHHNSDFSKTKKDDHCQVQRETNIPQGRDDATDYHVTGPVKIQLSANIYFIACLTVLLVSASVLSGRLPKSNGDFRSLYPAESQTLTELNKVEAEFGSMLNDIVLVDLSKEGSLEDVKFLEDDLLSIAAVEQVFSPHDSTGGYITTLSSDRQFGRLLLAIDPALQSEEQEITDSAINQVLADYPELDPNRTGLFAVSQAATGMIEKETFRLVPIASLLFLILLTIVFRSFWFAAAVLAAPLLNVTWAVIAFSLTGRSFGPISQLLPTFLISVGTSYSVHVAARLLECSLETIDRTIKEVGLAVRLATGTTIVGLLSLLLLDIQGVTEFAITAAIGVALSAWFALTLTAYFSLRWKQHRGAKAPKKLYSIDPAKLSSAIRTSILLSIAAIAAIGISSVSFTTSPETFLREGSPEARAADKMRRHFPGVEMLSATIRPAGNSNKSTLSSEELNATAKLKDSIEDIVGIEAMVGASDFSQAGKKLVPAESSFGPSSITKTDRSSSRLIIESSYSGQPLLDLARGIERAFNETLDSDKTLSGLSIGLASPGLLLAEQGEHLLRGVLYSLFLTLFAVSIVLLFLFRSFTILLIGLLPNVVPILLVFGAIGWLGWEVSVGVAIAGATALSIAVDDTFHLLIAWRDAGANSTSNKDCSAKAIRTAFSALFTTSLVLVSGFFVLLASQVPPIREYGAVMGCLLIVALWADIVVLPYFLKKAAAVYTSPSPISDKTCL
jgi:hypothetical protein